MCRCQFIRRLFAVWFAVSVACAPFLVAEETSLNTFSGPEILTALKVQAKKAGASLDYKVVRQYLDVYREKTSPFAAQESLAVLDLSKGEPHLFSLVLYWLNANRIYQNGSFGDRRRFFDGLLVLAKDSTMHSDARQTCIEYMRRTISSDLGPIEQWRSKRKEQGESTADAEQPADIAAQQNLARDRAEQLFAVMKDELKAESRDKSFSAKALMGECRRLFKYDLINRQEYQETLRGVIADTKEESRNRVYAARKLVQDFPDDNEIAAFLDQQIKLSSDEETEFNRNVKPLIRRKDK